MKRKLIINTLILLALFISMLVVTGCNRGGQMVVPYEFKYSFNNYYFNINDNEKMKITCEYNTYAFENYYEDTGVALITLSKNEIKEITEEEIKNEVKFSCEFKYEGFEYNKKRKCYIQELEFDVPMDIFDKNEGTFTFVKNNEINGYYKYVFNYYTDKDGNVEIYKENNNRIIEVPYNLAIHFSIEDEIGLYNTNNFIIKSYKTKHGLLKGIGSYELNKNAERITDYTKIRIDCPYDPQIGNCTIHKIEIRCYDFNEELTNEELIYECNDFEQEYFELINNKVYIVKAIDKNGDYLEYTFNTRVDRKCGDYEKWLSQPLPPEYYEWLEDQPKNDE